MKINKKATTDMLTGPIFKGILSMSIPIMIMNISQTLFNIMDMTTLRWFSDDTAVGAVGACGTLITLFTSLLIGTASGANVVIAKRIGAGKKELANKAVMTSILLSLVGGLLLMSAGVILAERILIMTDCPDKLLKGATLYFKIYFYGIPIQMLYNFCAAILRATGDTKRPMYYLLIGGAIKVMFTLLFVSRFNMTVDGVAFATIISNSVACFLALRKLIKSNGVIHVDFKKLRFSARELKEILFIGIPTGMQSALYSVANVAITTAVNGFGPDATTGISIANQFDGILYQISCAPSIAVIPFIAQNVGAKNIVRVKEITKKAILITILFGGSFGIASAVFSGQLSSIMTSTPAVIEYSRQKMIIISSTYFVCGINEVMCGVLRGMGKPIIPTVATLVYMCLFRLVWVYAIFPILPNLTFLYLVWPISWVLSIGTLLIAYLPAIKKLTRIIQQANEKEAVNV